MTDSEDWEFPESARPKAEELGYDLDRALSSVLALRSEIPEDAYTAAFLGTERGGNGVVIDDTGLVLTIGYLITEAQTVWLVSGDGTAAPAHVVGYDQASGFGLVQALGRLSVPALARGSARDSATGDSVVVAGHGGRAHTLQAQITSRREFAGYWEYVLDEAIFTAPPHPNWGGTALIGADGRLQGIGSLLVQEAQEGEAESNGNMFVPIDLLEPILDDLLKFGKVDQPPRPWLGMFTAESEGHIVIAGLARGAPAQRAELAVGDVVLGVAETPVRDLADFFRRIWARGAAGTVIPLTVSRDGQTMTVEVHSADRNDFLKSPGLH